MSCPKCVTYYVGPSSPNELETLRCDACELKAARRELRIYRRCIVDLEQTEDLLAEALRVGLAECERLRAALARARCRCTGADCTLHGSWVASELELTQEVCDAVNAQAWAKKPPELRVRVHERRGTSGWFHVWLDGVERWTFDTRRDAEYHARNVRCSLGRAPHAEEDGEP